ncbi:hypothetical protein B0H11DRAFT_2238235 [Mycena galericulata]|nr:hypothetical protein B0H11DRAFT_2238235 [Mycena galericulata]
MASTSTSTSIVLPSIHEMFPEHLMPRSAPPHVHTPSAFPRSHFVPPLQPHQSYSFDVLKSDPRGSSLQHIASSRSKRSDLPAVRTGTGRPSSSSGSSDGDAEMDDVEDGGLDGEEGIAEEGKKHVCPTCGKRFNRPSSLRIHVNTHTGATPFRCPHPSCGRAFNVNSNMRRHFRNHASPAFAGNNSSFPSIASPSSSPISPTSGPPSASWSVSSAGSLSPSTPASAYAAYAYSAPKPSLSTSLSPVSTWSPAPWPAPNGNCKSYSESDVRSERR